MQVSDFGEASRGDIVPVTGHDSYLKRDYSHFAYVPYPLPYAVELKLATHKAAGDAALAIGRLDFAVRRLPNPTMLVRPALRREAQSTSALEGTHATLGEILEADFAADEATLSAEVREVRNYIRAAERALELVATKPICVTILNELQAIMVKGTRGENADSGRLRTGTVYIGERHKGIEASRFVPPPWQAVPDGMSDWEKWVNTADEVPLVINLALAHYQFETLHPYSDGNGRLGRLVATLQLVTQEALTYPVLNLSPWLEARKDEYKDHLLRVSQTGDFDEWIQFFCEAVKAQATDGVRRIEDLLLFRDRVGHRLREARVRGVGEKIADELWAYPFITPTLAAELHNVTYPPANSAIAKLVELGLLREATGNRYGRMFVCDEVLEIYARD